MPGLCFLVLIVWHERVIRARHDVVRAIAHYERGLARIEDRWIGTGEPGTRFQDEHHPYAVDLDLFGPGSIFELLSTARTRDGEAALAGWLLTGARPPVIRERQQAVAELAPSVLLREQMAIAGDAVMIAVDTGGIRDWATQAVFPVLGRLRFTTYAAAAAAVAATTVLVTTGNALPLQVLFVLQLVVRQLQESSVERVLNVASGKARELDTLTQLLLHLESSSFSAARLVTLRGTLATPVSASSAIGRLQRLAERYAWRHSVPLVPVVLVGYAFTGADWALDAALVCASAFVLFTPFLALTVERWRRLHGPHVGG